MLTPEQSLVKTGSVRIAPTPEEKARKILTGTRRFFNRGANYVPQPEDYSVEIEKKQALRPYDVYLKKFQYGKALDAALKNGQPLIVTSVLDELVQRAGLKIALSNRDERSLEPILRFLVKYIAHPRYSQLLIDVANVLLDMYSGVLGQSIVVDELIMRLKMQIDEETELQKHMLHLLGSLNLILAANAPLSSSQPLSSAAATATAASSLELPAIQPLKETAVAEQSGEDEEMTPASAAAAATTATEEEEEEKQQQQQQQQLRYEGKRSTAGKAAERAVAMDEQSSDEEEEEQQQPNGKQQHGEKEEEEEEAESPQPKPRQAAAAAAGGKKGAQKASAAAGAAAAAKMNGVSKKMPNGVMNGQPQQQHTQQKTGTKRKR